VNHFNLRNTLESLAIRFSHAEYIESDPLLFPLRYTNKNDQEIVALLSALFAYGNVKAIKSFLENLLIRLGESPYNTLLSGNFNCDGLYYRFQTESDIKSLLNSLSETVKEHNKNNTSEYEPVFERFLISESIFSGIASFERKLLSYTENPLPGLKHLIGDGRMKKGARKRMMLFLRWMVRSGFPDLGLYRTISPAQLIVPLDVHMARIGIILGFTERSSADSVTALEITRGLAGIDPVDPLRFDFFLTRPGILGDCRSRNPEICKSCEIYQLCRKHH
jgi:uncharacterized protein (TIGR02757 family)